MPIVEGISSGLETGKIIQKLKEVEKRPIIHLEKQKNEIHLENQALKEVQGAVKELQDSVKVLYNFEAKYEARKLVSDPPGFVEGLASKKASPNNYKLTIKNLASKLVIGSKTLQKKEEIPSGTITLNGKRKTFRGGNLKNFKDFLNRNYPDILSAKHIRKNSKEEILILESKQEGEKGIFKIKDHDSLLKKLKIYDPEKKNQAKEQTPPKDTKRENLLSLLFDPLNIGVLKEGPVDISPDQKSMLLKEYAARNLPASPPLEEDRELKFLSLHVKHPSASPSQEDNAPDRLYLGPTQNINIKGILLDTYNVYRKRKKEKPTIREFDYGIRINSKGESKAISFKEKSSYQRIPVTADIASIDFYTQNTQVVFSDLHWVFETTVKPQTPVPVRGEEPSGNGLEPEQASIFPNLLHPARNAELNLDGVDLERDSNKGLDGIIEGAQLDLIKKTDSPINISITNDYEGVKKQIHTFVDAYNNLLKLSQKSTTNKVLNSKPGKFDKMAKLKGDTGVLVTNLSVRTLLNGLKKRISDPYPSFREPHLKILNMVGISTGEIGSRWEDISDGHLQINEQTLEQVLTKSPVAVKEFFGSDTNQDQRVDNGLAFHIHKLLKPYAQNYSRGILYTNIKSNEDRIKQIDEKIVHLEEKADRYEEKLKRKFGAMESAIHRQKSIGQEIKSKLDIQPENKKKNQE